MQNIEKLIILKKNKKFNINKYFFYSISYIFYIKMTIYSFKFQNFFVFEEINISKKIKFIFLRIIYRKIL